jgi:shikimate kinase
MRIFLIGMPGSGKTYWMAQLAEQLQYRGVDMDHFIEEQTGSTIPELFAISEEHFRAQEKFALEAIIHQYEDKVVIATGGGAPCYKDNMPEMKSAGCVIYLETAIESLLSNVKKSGVPRPLLANGASQELAEKLSALYRQRKEIYEQAHIKINVDKATLATFADAITQYLSDQNPT